MRVPRVRRGLGLRVGRACLSFWVFAVAKLAVLDAAVLLLVQTVGWSAVGEWFLVQTALTGSAYFLAVTAVAAVFGYLVLRGATPVS